MGNNAMSELNDDILRAKQLAERADLLAFEVNKFVFDVDYSSRNHGEGEAHLASIKSDMLLEIISEIHTILTTLDRLTTPSKEAPKNHRDMTRAERIDEILNEITEAVGKIENRPDWLDRMKILNFCAIVLAMGWTGVNVTGTAPND